jgi:hypothetical protein
MMCSRPNGRARAHHSFPFASRGFVKNPCSVEEAVHVRNQSTQSHPVNITEDGSGKAKPSLKARAIDEIKSFVVITLYLWLLLGLFDLLRTIALEQAHVNLQEQGLAIVNALILAKVMLIAEDLKLGSRFEDSPLIYSVLWKSAAFSVVLICFHIVEDAALAWLHGKPLADSLAAFGSGDLKGVLAVGAILFVALIPFFMFAEIGRVVGHAKLWQLLLTRHRKSISLQARG